jgi:hypothetical protein
MAPRTLSSTLYPRCFLAPESAFALFLGRFAKRSELRYGSEL